MLLAAALAGQLLVVSAVSAQTAVSSSGAVVRVPPVAWMDVEPVQSGAVEESVRIRVRANHGWEVVVAAPLDGPVWVRASIHGEAGEYRRVEPGSELTVAAGDQGVAEVRLDYRWERSDHAMPLTYTLASR